MLENCLIKQNNKKISITLTFNKIVSYNTIEYPNLKVG